MTAMAKHVLSARNAFRRRLAFGTLGALWLIASPGAFAERVSRSEFDAFRDLVTGTGKHTVGVGSNGTPLVTRPVNSTAAGVGNMNFAPGSGTPDLHGKARLPLPGGRGADLLVRQPISKAAAARAVAGFAFRFAGWPIAVGSALYILSQEFGYKRIIDGETGMPSWEKEKKTQHCVSGTCYEFRYITPGSWSAAPYIPFPQSSCDAGRAWYNSQAAFPYNMSSVVAVQTGGPGQWACTATLSHKNTGAYYTTRTDAMQSRTVPPQTQVQYEPITEEQMANEVASAAGWPDSRNQALSEALKGGQTIDLTDAAAVSVPADQSVIDGGKLTSRNVLPSGNTLEKTEAKQYKITANPDGTITVKEETTTTEREISPGGTVVPGSEKITGTTEKDQDKVEPTQTEKCTAKSSSLECSELDLPEGEIPKETKAVTYQAEDLGFGGGACPADIVRQVNGQPLTVFSFGQGCTLISTYVKPLVLLLSAFMAMLIVMPGGVKL